MSRYSQNARNLYYSYLRRIQKGISDYSVTRIGDKKWRVLPILSRTPRSRSEGWIVEAKKFPPDTSDFGKIFYPGKDSVQEREIKCPCSDATATEDYGRDWTFSRAGLFYPCKHIIAVLIKEKVDFIKDTLLSPSELVIRMTCDNTFTLFLNGVEVGSGDDWPVAKVFSVDFLYENQIAVACSDFGVISGLLGDISVNNGSRINTDSSWKYSLTEQTGWKELNFDESSWTNATEVANYQAGWWPPITNMDGTTAKWIWSSSQSDDLVYFRKKLIF